MPEAESVKQEKKVLGVKSALRVFEVIEYFAQEQRDLSVMEIARFCGYPQSSTSALLRTMVEAGYLDYDSSSRTYLPTARVALLGSWVGSRLFSEGRVTQIMNELSEATGQTIILGNQRGLRAQYIKIINARVTLRLHFSPGCLRPLARSAIGYALLSHRSDTEISKMVRRINAEAEDPDSIIPIAEVLDRVRETRERGYAVSYGYVTPGAGTVAMRLPENLDSRPLVVGIGASLPSIIVNEKAWAELLHNVIERSFID